MPTNVQFKDGIAPIPLLDLNRQYQLIRDDVLSAIERVCSSQQFVLGQEVDALERELAAYVGAAHAIGCASGTDALWLSLAAAGVGPGDRVITTPFSFFASASSIVRAGAEPVFVDIEPETMNLDPANVRDFLKKTSGFLDSNNQSVVRSMRFAQNDRRKRGQSQVAGRIKAILPVHLYGQCA